MNMSTQNHIRSSSTETGGTISATPRKTHKRIRIDMRIHLHRSGKQSAFGVRYRTMTFNTAHFANSSSSLARQCNHNSLHHLLNSIERDAPRHAEPLDACERAARLLDSMLNSFLAPRRLSVLHRRTYSTLCWRQRWILRVPRRT